jgi:hypothetical protein
MDPPEAYRAIVHELLGDPAVSEGQMMGMPAVVPEPGDDWLRLAEEAKAFTAEG